jgi:hypothetical protein
VKLTRRQALAAQSAYFAVTGVWPLLDERSFQAVTGPKLEMWLAKTVGAAVAAAGASLAVAAARRRESEPEVLTLAFGSAAALGLVDLVYVAKGRISPVYLVDAVAEAALAVAIARADPQA